MSIFSRKVRPYIADPIPLGRIVQDTGASVLIEQAARMDEAARILRGALAAKTGHEDACLDALSALSPSDPDPQDLREVPPVPERYAVPVIPGRAS